WTPLPLPAAVAVRSLLELPGPGGPALFVGTEGRGVLRHQAGRWTVFDHASGLPNDTVFALAPDRMRPGALWAGTDAGLARFDGEGWIAIDERRGLPRGVVRSLLETGSPGSPATLWVGTSGGGVARLRSGSWVAVDASAGLPTNVVRTLLETVSPAGEATLWI